MEAYSRLASSRNMNGVIPISEILAYANGFELISSLEEFVDVINLIDRIYIDKQSEESERDKKKKEQEERSNKNNRDNNNRNNNKVSVRR